MKALKILFLCLFATAVFAQQDQPTEQATEQEVNKKKPSWSTGLPERKSAPTMNKPPATIGQSEIDLSPPERLDMPTTDVVIDRESFAMPEITIESAPPSAAVPPVARSSSKLRKTSSFDNTESSDTENEIESSIDEPVAAKVVVAETNGQNNYDWEILQSEPVKIPKSLTHSYKNVELEVYINPAGEVVKVKRISDLTSNQILSYSTLALKKWQFRPPEEFGINEVIKNIMMVDLVAR